MKNKSTDTNPSPSHLRVVHVQSHVGQKINERIQFLENQKVEVNANGIDALKDDSAIVFFNKSIEWRLNELRWMLKQCA